jgi:hypothetical protein
VTRRPQRWMARAQMARPGRWARQKLKHARCLLMERCWDRASLAEQHEVEGEGRSHRQQRAQWQLASSRKIRSRPKVLGANPMVPPGERRARVHVRAVCATCMHAHACAHAHVHDTHVYTSVLCRRLEREVVSSRLWLEPCRRLAPPLPEAVPVTFASVQQYVDAFEPLLLEEAIAGVRSTAEEAERTGRCASVVVRR